MVRDMIIKYGPTEPRRPSLPGDLGGDLGVIKYGPPEPRGPVVPRLRISPDQVKQVIDDYLDLLGKIEKAASSGTVDAENLVSALKDNLRLLETRFNALRKRQRGSVILYAVIVPRDNK